MSSPVENPNRATSNRTQEEPCTALSCSSILQRVRSAPYLLQPWDVRCPHRRRWFACPEPLAAAFRCHRSAACHLRALARTCRHVVEVQDVTRQVNHRAVSIITGIRYPYREFMDSKKSMALQSPGFTAGCMQCTPKITCTRTYANIRVF